MTLLTLLIVVGVAAFCLLVGFGWGRGDLEAARSEARTEALADYDAGIRQARAAAYRVAAGVVETWPRGRQAIRRELAAYLGTFAVLPEVSDGGE